MCHLQKAKNIPLIQKTYLWDNREIKRNSEYIQPNAQPTATVSKP